MNQRILVVEDDESIGQTVSTTLKSHGYLVQWSKDGAAATAFVMDALRHAERSIGFVGTSVDVASDHRAERASRRNTSFSSGALGL